MEFGVREFLVIINLKTKKMEVKNEYRNPVSKNHKKSAEDNRQYLSD